MKKKYKKTFNSLTKITVILMSLSFLSLFALDDVKLRLNWMYYGSHAGFALGKVDGTYKKQDINLDIRSGNGSTSAHRLVANGDSMFSYGSCAALVTLIAQGAPLISVGVIDATGTEAIIVHPDEGIRKIKDLKGKTILTTANAGVNTLFPIVLDNAGLKKSDLKVINVADGALVTSYLQKTGGSVGILGGVDDKPAEIKANGGKEPLTFLYSDYGVNQVGYCIAARRDTVEKKPDLVKRFMKATVESYAQALKSPNSAVEAVADIVGGSLASDEGKKQTREVLDVTLGILFSKNNTKKVLGLHVAKDWDDMLALMVKYNGLETDRKASYFYTNEFVD